MWSYLSQKILHTEVLAVIHTIAKPSTHLINLSITSGSFLSEWKLARVIAIFNSGVVDQACNYGSIGIFPVFSKVVEKVVDLQLMKYVESNNYLHPLQFGFRPYNLTETAICFVIEQLKSLFDKGEVVWAVFLDLKKAFNT